MDQLATMRGKQPYKERRAQANLIQGVEDAQTHFSSRSCQIISKKKPFKNFLALMAEKAPETMRTTLKNILRTMPRSTGNDLTGAGRKRAGDQAARNEARKTKKAKLDRVRLFGREAIQPEGGEQEAQTVHSIAHSTRSWTLNRRMASESLFLGGEQDEMKVEENEMGEAEAQEEEDNEGAEAMEEDEDSEDGEAVEQELLDTSGKLKDYTAYQIEEGLTRGTPAIANLFTSEFSKIPRLSNGGYSGKDGSRILFACQKLQFETVVDALKTFFRAPARRSNPIPSSCDVNDPSHLLRILREIDGFIQEPKVHKAFTQMKFFTTINARAEAQGWSNYLDLVKHLVGQEYGAVSQNYVDEKVKEYLSDYHKGRKWLETAQSFGGTAAVFIIIVAGIGAGKADRDWTDYERSCLNLAISYLPSVKKIVECLGASALEDFCRHGNLPKEKIQELEELEGTMPDTDSEDEDQESDEDDNENEDE